jgi:hypothetical protein
MLVREVLNQAAWELADCETEEVRKAWRAKWFMWLLGAGESGTSGPALLYVSEGRPVPELWDGSSPWGCSSLVACDRSLPPEFRP